MAVTRIKKEEQLTKLERGFGEGNSAVFTGYHGLTVAQLTELRKKLKEEKIDFMVSKKTLIRKAAEKNGITDIPEDVLAKEVGIAFGFGDEVAPARVTNTFAKKHKFLVIRGGIMNGAVIDAQTVKTLAMLPGIDELRAKVVGGFIAPVRGFVTTLNGVISGFARVISAIQKQKA